MIGIVNIKRKIQNHFIIFWLIANIFGVLFGIILFNINLFLFREFGSQYLAGTNDELESTSEMMKDVLIIFFPLYLGILVSQWIALRTRLKRVGLWIPTSIIGYLFIAMFNSGGDLIRSPFLGDVHAVFVMVGIGPFIGLVIGIMQWLVLRLSMLKPISWIIINIGAFSIMFYMGLFLGPIWGIAGWILFSLVSGYWLNYRLEIYELNGY